MKGYIYKLTCPIKNEPVYVGSTSISLKARLIGHLTEIKGSDYPIYTYFRKNNCVPIMEQLEEIDFENVYDLHKRETFWIDFLKESGYILFNKTRYTKQKSPEKGKMTAIKISKEVFDIVKENKEKTGIPIGVFLKLAAIEKLKLEGVSIPEGI